MTKESDNTPAIVQRSRELRARARRLRQKAGKICQQSGEIREVLLVNGPPKRSGNSVYRGAPCLIDVLDRILDTGIMVEPWRRLTLTGIHVSTLKGRLKTSAIQTYLLNEEIVTRKRKRLRLPSGGGEELYPVLQPANFLDILDRILDKGIVVDSWQHIHVLGIDVLGPEASVASASVQIHLLYESQLVHRAVLHVKTASASA